jgi:hypothetical protein
VIADAAAEEFDSVREQVYHRAEVLAHALLAAGQIDD